MDSYMLYEKLERENHESTNGIIGFIKKEVIMILLMN